MLKLSVKERADFSLVDAPSMGFLRSDYLALRYFDSLTRQLGYRGLADRSTSVHLMGLDATENTDGMDVVADAQETSQEARDVAQEGADGVIREGLHAIQAILPNVRTRGAGIVTGIKGSLRNLIGLHLKGSKGPSPKKLYKHKIDEIDEIWKLAWSPNDFYGEKWKARMTEKITDLRKNTDQRKGKKRAEVEKVEQILEGKNDENWQW